MEINLNKISFEKKKRGRPCALERHRNELIQQKVTNLINTGVSDNISNHNIVPFILKRQRRSKANDRERGRMGTLNNALGVLKKHLPEELYAFKLLHDK